MPSVSVIERLTALGHHLPVRATPTANYVLLRRSGTTLFLSGQDPVNAEGLLHRGVVGRNVTAAEATEHARQVGLQLLAALDAVVADYTRIEVLNVFGMVNCTPDFTEHARVIDGCSDLFVAVLGKNGTHARSVAGMTGLPDSITVEIEAICRIRD